MTPAPRDVTLDGYESRLLRRRWITEDTFLLELERPPGFRFIAGQRIQLLLEEEARDYSLIPVQHAEAFALLIRRVPEGIFTNRLSRCPEGARLRFRGPSGHFIYRRTPRAPVFIATGTGVAPFAAMCRRGAQGMILLHGVRRAEDLYFQDLLEAAAGLYVPCLSGGPDRVPAGAYPGRVTDYLRRRLPPGDYDFYLAGRREMIADVIAIVDDRFPSSRLYSEIFY